MTSSSQTEEFVKHARRIHFSVVAASAALVIAGSLGAETEKRHDRALALLSDLQRVSWEDIWESPETETRRLASDSLSGDNANIFAVESEDGSQYLLSASTTATIRRIGGHIEFNESDGFEYTRLIEKGGRTEFVQLESPSNWREVKSLIRALNPEKGDLLLVSPVEPVKFSRGFDDPSLRGDVESLSLAGTDNDLQTVPLVSNRLVLLEEKKWVVVWEQGSQRITGEFNVSISPIVDLRPRLVAQVESVSSLREFTAILDDLDSYVEDDSTDLQTLELKKDELSPVEVTGLKIPASAISAWGLPILIVLQLYFALHFSALVRQGTSWTGLPNVPWIALYDDATSRLVFIVSSSALPFLSAVSLSMFRLDQGQNHTYFGVLGVSSIRLYLLIAVLSSLVLSIWVLRLSAELRRIRSSKSDSEDITAHQIETDPVSLQQSDDARTFPVTGLLYFYLAATGVVLAFSWIFGNVEFPARQFGTSTVVNQLSADSIVSLFSGAFSTFSSFAPIQNLLPFFVLLVTGVYTGFFEAAAIRLNQVLPSKYLTPVVTISALLLTIFVDLAYLLVIPTAGALFYIAGRHPVAGICCAFAATSAGFGASFGVSALQPFLDSLTLFAAQTLDHRYSHELANVYFANVLAFAVIPSCWYITDRIVEPMLHRRIPMRDLDSREAGEKKLCQQQRRALTKSAAVFLALVGALSLWALSSESSWQTPDGSLLSISSPLLRSINAIAFLLLATSCIVYGYTSRGMSHGRVRLERLGLSSAMIAQVFLLMFVVSQLTYVLGQSNLSRLVISMTVGSIDWAAIPPALAIFLFVLFTAIVNFFVSTSSGKWALIAPEVVPAFMSVGISPALVQAAYLVGDSPTNVLSPIMSFFPLVFLLCVYWSASFRVFQFLKLMFVYSAAFLALWTLLLLTMAATGVPLGIESSYSYP